MRYALKIFIKSYILEFKCCIWGTLKHVFIYDNTKATMTTYLEMDVLQIFRNVYFPHAADHHWKSTKINLSNVYLYTTSCITTPRVHVYIDRRSNTLGLCTRLPICHVRTSLGKQTSEVFTWSMTRWRIVPLIRQLQTQTNSYAGSRTKKPPTNSICDENITLLANLQNGLNQLSEVVLCGVPSHCSQVRTNYRFQFAQG